jgi:hypothetical protein
MLLRVLKFIFLALVFVAVIGLVRAYFDITGDKSKIYSSACIGLTDDYAGPKIVIRGRTSSFTKPSNSLSALSNTFKFLSDKYTWINPLAFIDFALINYINPKVKLNADSAKLCPLDDGQATVAKRTDNSYIYGSNKGVFIDFSNIFFDPLYRKAIVAINYVPSGIYIYYEKQNGKWINIGNAVSWVE